MNLAIFQAINNSAGQWSWLDWAGKFLARDFLFIFIAIVLILWFKRNLRWRVYLALAAALISRFVIVELLKKWLDQPRPFEVVSNIHQLLVDEKSGFSFPSGHTAIFFSLAFAFYGTKYFWPFIVLAIIGSLARIFVGVHFPLDIVASVFIAMIVVWSLKRLFKPKILG
ncbi:MAG: hypothetical protein A3B10_03490 [Candidatus Doudnabacteria bacterium RIFCSPLOWO2_01_FULL_44_21]|uniref:Phosphatidic acid phosphatase type 2/haloperoxidase domain-containing protein n=1 Tax=Candidatus Doudnabacteria bacterium RIFCSPLOWO2_01_FULL_44_21 TaxID=1817841 RepID=A0A1F5PYA8_9BACT|nr:MAG: hypothetical protein A3B95_02355 [Candidatus Doudnabacteria bacterium RIFCSPHIGHO2_02_FULL_43_13b]OGE94827.1 MAG: hypothetical protein A3B10_03490 [Candidatus Doudnabacteria bacterium RIFCSPLOWO2_01_FULL_44_21]